MDSASSDHIFKSFPVAVREDWQKAAKLELDGVDPFQKLGFEKSNLKIKPYYDRQDIRATDYFQLNPAANEFLDARHWFNMPALAVQNEVESNQRALSDLNSGADGTLFDLKIKSTNPTSLLNKIEWPYCAISFKGNVSNDFLTGIQKHATSKNYDVSTLTGCVFRDKSEEKKSDLALFENWNNFHPLGIIVEERESSAEALAMALARAVRQVDFVTDNGISLSQALQAQAFYVDISEDFFLSIARLKALRFLWNNVASSFNPDVREPIFIHASSSVWTKKEYEPNGNMLKSTTAALSAVLGGCNGLTVSPEADNHTMMTRIARNVSSVLREESHLSKVADPTAGSYYLESLTEQLADQAWQKFQKM